MRALTREQAIAKLEWLGADAIAVGIQMATGKAWYAARDRMEAQRWVNFQRDFIVPGTQPQFAVRDW